MIGSNEQVAHVWANQGKQSGRTHNGNMSFEGPILYSYSTPIARLIDGHALFSSQSFSVTTQGKHMNPARRAVRYHGFTVPFLIIRADGAHAGRGPGAAADFAALHAANLESYAARITEAVESAKRARANKAWKIEAAARLAREASDYARAFGLSWSAPDDFESLLATVDGWKAETAKREAREKRAAAKRLREQRKADLEAFAAWQAAEPGARLPSSFRTDERGAAYIRRNGDNLETSQGAVVPWDHAVKAFRFIKLCREQGRTFQRNGRTIRVGHFQVDEIDAKGNMRAGCHLFQWKEIERLAKAHGVFDQAADDSAVVSTAHA